MHGTQSHKHCVRVFAKHNGCPVHCQKVADIKLAYELHTYFPAVYLKIHALEVALYDLGLEVGRALHRIGLHLRLGVLHHDHAVLVVSIGDGEGCGWQIVEEEFLGFYIVVESLVVVEVVAGDVGEESSNEVQASYAVLDNAVAAHLHEGIFASCLNHLGQKRIEGDGVGRGVLRGYHLSIYVVGNGGQESCLVSHAAEHLIEHCGNGCLAIGASHSDQLQLACRIAIEGSSD